MIINVGDRVREGIYFDELDYGEVCEFLSKCGCKFIGMKVDSSLGKDFILDLDDSKLYTDIENYTAVRVFKNAKLVE